MKLSEYTKEIRSKVLIYTIVFLMSVIFFRLFQLQIIKSSYYRGISEGNRIHPVALIAPRGIIYDREGKVLVSNGPSYTISVFPYQVEDEKQREVILKLSSILSLEKSYLEKKLEVGWPKRFQAIKLKRDVDFATLCIIEEKNEDLAGVFFETELKRKYPQRDWTGNLLGYVGKKPAQINDSIKTEDPELFGIEGIEKKYDQDLRGKNGVKYFEVSAVGKILGELEEKKPDLPVKGSDLVLTIDLDLQNAAEDALEPYSSGCVIAMDPKTGEILAMVSKPGFDSNLFSGVLTEKKWEELINDPKRPLLNRCTQGLYPPGSTLKLLTAAAALEEKIIEPNTFLSPCKGVFYFGNRAFHCWRPEGHGKIDLKEAIVFSCDVYFYQLGLKLGLEKWSEYAKKCGLDRVLKVDLPYEQKGFIPTLKFYKKKYGEGNWVKNLVINLSIGQGEIVLTPIGLASFFCGLVNNGEVYYPHLLKELIEKDKRIINNPNLLLTLPFSTKTLRFLKDALVGVVNHPKGTGVAAKMKEVVVGGKTGTTENPYGKPHASFVGFAPAKGPEILVYVLIENGGHGGEVAAPIAKIIFKKYFDKKAKKDVMVKVPEQKVGGF